MDQVLNWMQGSLHRNHWETSNQTLHSTSCLQLSGSNIMLHENLWTSSFPWKQWDQTWSRELLSSEQLYLPQHRSCVSSTQQPKPQNHCICYTTGKQTRCTLTRNAVTMSLEDSCSVPKNYFPSLPSPTFLPYELLNEFLPQTLKPYSSQSKSKTIPKRARQHRTSEILQTARLDGKLLPLPHTDGHTRSESLWG